MLATELSPLTAISPLDGRYRSQLPDGSDFFSEFSLIKNRLQIEVAYLFFLAKEKLIPAFSPAEVSLMQTWVSSFSMTEAEKVKAWELKTKHDVKSLEYYLRQRMTHAGISQEKYVHLALTSEDTNSLAYSLMIKKAQGEHLVPALKKVLQVLMEFATDSRLIPMLARTHGQPAVPTTVGKEISHFAMRLLPEIQALESLPMAAKLTGAVGNFNAHLLLFPKSDWLKLSQTFIESLGLEPELFTTQILPTESYSRFFTTLVRINSILLDLNQDLWRYISDGYFIQKPDPGQVGSSTLPHKVNPIDFENSEGTLGLANSILNHFVTKLPISRLQRDLSDSSVKRHFGMAFGLCLLGYGALTKGVPKLIVDEALVQSQLNAHPEVLTEAFQVMLRGHGDSEGYEKLQRLSQGKKITLPELHEFLNSVELPAVAKQELLSLTPSTYLGLAPELTNQAISVITLYLQGAS